MIPYGHQFIDKEDIEAVLKVFKSDWITQGPKISEFEKALAKYCGAKFAVVCSSGTSALHLAYLAVGLKKGDEVVTTSNTFAATANMLLVVGAKPVFCDIRLDTYNIDEGQIKKSINKRTKAIVPVHFAGHPCEMEKIWKIARKHKLLVIEDACHALGARYKNSKIGSCKYSDMAIFSFHPVKSITTGEGGAILTNNKKYYKKLVSLRSHGIHKDKKGKNVMTELGYNYRITDIQAALGISQLKKLDGFIRKRHAVVNKYKKELAGIKGIILPQELINVYSAWHIFIIRVKGAINRDTLVQFLKNSDIGVNFHYPAVYSHPYYRSNGYKNVILSSAEEYDKSCLTLPCHVLLRGKEIHYISDLIKKYFSDHNGRRKIQWDKAKVLGHNHKINGKRIYLRPLCLKNATQEYCNWLNDKEVNKYLETRQCSVEDLKKYIQRQVDDPNSFFVGIFDKNNDKHIGNIKLEPIDWAKKKALFGILIGNKIYRGRGFGAEATKLIVDYAFGQMGLEKIELGVIDQNLAAIKAYENAGFKIDKIEKKSIAHGTKLFDKIKMFIKK